MQLANRRHELVIGMVLAVLAAVCFGAAVAAAQQADGKAGTLPLTTRSPEALQLVQTAWELNLDQVEQEKAVEVLRKAVQIDPNFAMAHELLAQSSLDPAEQVREQHKAFATRGFASPAERQVIEWWQDASDHKLISAITKMNDVLAQYPHDKWVVFLSTWWLTLQTQNERAVAVYQRSGITDSPGLMNNTAYAYAYMRQFEPAFALMDQYVAALPGDANPQDSYAEILRMAGKFDKAVEHYRAALTINPEFYSSEFGIADTYSLMGDQDRARKEYEVAFKRFPLPELHQVQWKTREAQTYVREGDFAGADKAFQAIADQAHAKHMSQVEADTYRQMAMYQPSPKKTLFFINRADAAIREGKNSMPAALQQERAQVLRARIEANLKSGNRLTAQSELKRLAAMASNSSDRLIEVAWQGAAGAVAFSQHKYDDAISHLEEDTNNPLSLKLLAEAYQKIGDSAGAKRTSQTLASINDPTLEQALVVLPFRKCYPDSGCSGNVKAVSLKK